MYIIYIIYIYIYYIFIYYMSIYYISMHTCVYIYIYIQHILMHMSPYIHVNVYIKGLGNALHKMENPRGTHPQMPCLLL